MSLVHPLTIFFVLLGGAVVIPQLDRRLSGPARALLTLITVSGVFLLTIGVFRGAPVPVQISSWAALDTADQGIRFAVTPFAGRFLVLTLFVLLTVTLAALDEPWAGPTDDYKAVILAVAAGLAAYVTADNLLAWLVAWLTLDVMWIFATGLPGRSGWPLETGLLQGGGLFCLFCATILIWQEYGSMSFVLPERPSVAAFLIVGALILRMGVYPLHLFTRAGDHVPERIRAVAPVVVIGGGGYWLIRWTQEWGVAWLPEQGVMLMAVGFVASGLLAWRREDATARSAALMAWFALTVIWALWYERPDLAAGFLWSGSLALAALALHGGEGERRRDVLIPGVVAGLALIGAPGSAMGGLGWLAVVALASGNQWLAAAGVVGLAGVTAAVAHMLLTPASAPRQPSRWTGMTLLALAAWPALGGLLWLRPDVGTDVSVNVPGWLSFGMLLLGWVGGLLLWRARDVLGQADWLIDGLVDVLNVTWLWQWSARLVWSVAGMIRGSVRIIEGENYGWLLLFLLVAFLFLAQ